MKGIEIIAKTESKFRPLLMKLPPKQLSMLFSFSRKLFLNEFVKSVPDDAVRIPDEFSKTLWGLKFQSPVFNAAGMFKSGLGYKTCAYQGAGAFLAGTTTALERRGNSKLCITHPFIPLNKSAAAINWMGLPNEGHEIIAKRMSRIEKITGCQVGASLSNDPSQTGDEAMYGLLSGMKNYNEAKVDFIEINESCPNVPHEHGDLDSSGLDRSLIERLSFISDKFLKNRTRNLPTIVKFSNDTAVDQIESLIGLLVDLGFDGANFGNTSTQYDTFKKNIIKEEHAKYDFFIDNFGGGLSGRLLKASSLKLSSEAVKVVGNMKPSQEFHIIRTGGIENNLDIKESEDNGILLNQWFSGYFEQFGKHGHKLYGYILNF